MGSTRSASSAALTFVLVAAVTLSYSGFLAPVLAQDASACDISYTLKNGTKKTFTFCQNLVVQEATLAWSYFPGDNVTGGVLDLAFTETLPSAGGWVGWGINPTQQQMVGSSVLIAFTDSSSGAVVLPYKLNSDLVQANPARLNSGATDLDLLDSSVAIDASSLKTNIFAKLQLKPSQTTFYHIWNKGPSVDNRIPSQHDLTSRESVTSLGALDVVNGTVVAGNVKTPAMQNIHGVLNAISWGVLFPVGIMVARYMKPFSLFHPFWFYLHVGCQVCGYILGVAGFATGLKILDKADVKYEHRNLGIALFAFATVQIAALLIRPGPKHKLRTVWNVYHYAVGYAIVAMSIVNIFKGFDLLLPAEGWKRAYIAVILALAAIALMLEIFTWIVWLRQKFRARHSSAAGSVEDGSGGRRGMQKGGFAPNGKTAPEER